MNLIATYGKYLAMQNLLFLKALMGERVTKYDWVKFYIIMGVYFLIFQKLAQRRSAFAVCGNPPLPLMRLVRK